jgi:PAS domain S-box-containing protein
LLVIAHAVRRLHGHDAIVIAVAGFFSAAITFAVMYWSDRTRWHGPVSELSEFIKTIRRGEPARPPVELPDRLMPIVRDLVAVVKSARRRGAGHKPPPPSFPTGLEFPSLKTSVTRSGLFDAPSVGIGSPDNPHLSGDYSTIDMVNRLEPVTWRWIESSPAEQILLGWNLRELRTKSFLDVLHHEDRGRVEATFLLALERGEALGLIVRIRTAQGDTRSIEVNAGARYGADRKVSHLRCHLTDVTEKVRAERELRLRTRELTRVNEQLRRINRELEDLKDRYTDLYENAPAMYFSLDAGGCIIECNQTMLSTLRCHRGELIGRPYESLLHESSHESFRGGFAEFLREGALESERRWIKPDGEVIDVWVLGQVVRGLKDGESHARFVAQDVTARRRLETELQEKNQRLALANEELSRKNRELDEFAYVVSHDLQEPLRTLIAFSDFLVKDYADRLEEEGQEFVRYLVGAARRMSAMIQGMLHLSRAGKVIGEFHEVDLEGLVAIVRTDLGELIRSKGADVRVVGPLPLIWGDSDRIRQLLANLIANGLKYNQSRTPRVEIGAIVPDGTSREDSDRAAGHSRDVTIFVRDNGIGIEPQFQMTIFQLFRRLHSQEEYEGTGAGLAICDKIVQAHGGRIWVESSPGEGATFRFQLPAPPFFASATSPSPAETETETRVTEVALDEYDAV